jgi:hypothetical protein
MVTAATARTVSPARYVPRPPTPAAAVRARRRAARGLR